ncbi:MAG: hypothetical protein AAGI01_15835 [Myxococcota bacterium]
MIEPVRLVVALAFAGTATWVFLVTARAILVESAKTDAPLGTSKLLVVALMVFLCGLFAAALIALGVEPSAALKFLSGLVGRS